MNAKGYFMISFLIKAFYWPPYVIILLFKCYSSNSEPGQMTTQIRLNILIIVISQLLVISLNRVEAQGDNMDHIRFMFYNVENLFDTFDDTLTDDQEFLPDGLKKWTKGRYMKKIDGLYKTIVAAGKWSPPEVIAFCETENRKVLNDLITRTYLSKFDYRIVHEDSPDRRGIDVCLIYRNKMVKLIDYRYMMPKGFTKDYFKSRTVLYARLGLNPDTIHLFVNHWPSRRGGVLAGEKLRIRLADMIKGTVDSLIQRDPCAKIVILGDFNCNPGDREVEALMGSENNRSVLFSLSKELYTQGTGTYKYLGVWEMIDQVIVSKGLLAKKGGSFFVNRSLSIFHSDFLLAADRKYSGLKPFSTYRGYLYQGGFSDHLPLILDMKRAGEGQQE
jgi:hypothetical protein